MVVVVHGWTECPVVVPVVVSCPWLDGVTSGSCGPRLDRVPCGSPSGS